jgi:hypothetical protein
MPGIYTDVRPTEGTSPPSGVSRPDETEAPAQKAGASAMPEDFTGKGYLLEEPDEKKVFKAIDEEVERQEPLAKNRAVMSKWRAAVRQGKPFVGVKKDADRSIWEYEEPPGGSQPSPIPNKADDLNRKIVSQVVVDLPAPDPKPATDSEQDRGAADLAKRFLKTDGDESGTNDPELFRDILDSAMTDASSFAHVWVDMTGGGWRPLQNKAHPQAQDASNPLVATQPVMDPMTGQPAIDPMTGQPQMQEIPTSEYVLRYVSEEGQFVESAAEAKRQWLPKVCRDVLGPAHVRTIPETADVANAEGVILLMFGPVSDLKRRVPDLDESIVPRLATWKPRRHKALVPQAMRARLKEQQGKKDAAVDDSTLIFWMQKYCSVGPDYIDGASLIVSGADGGIVITKSTLRHDIPTEDGVRVLLRDIPVAQDKALHDSETRDPFGKAPIDLFGSTNEGLAQLYGSALEDTDKRLHSNTFLPSTSPVQGWQLRDRTGDPVFVYSKDDLPTFEQHADLPSFLPQMIELMEGSMREAAMLGSAAEMLNTPDAVSGKAKSIELNQAKTALAPVAQNFFAFVKRYWRLKLELAQAFLTIPQEVEYVGLDQAYKQRWFTGADFGGVKDVAIMAGTGTLMSPTEKQAYLGVAQDRAWLDPEEAGEAGRSSVADDLGLQSMPAEDAIKRELAEWMKGPPQQWQGAKPQVDPATQQPVMGPNGQPAMSPPSWTPFQTRPTDEDPMVAKRQYKVLRDFVYTNDYSKHPPEWRALVDQRVALAQYSAGVQTMRQQAEAAAAQQQQQAGEKDKDRQFKKTEGDANRAAKAQERVAA